ncbi:MAG: hypothetical protein FJ292_09080 [Planctomycetes bacterium]|nr:hypothetical protein [Planctomycetota bacterium]
MLQSLHTDLAGPGRTLLASLIALLVTASGVTAQILPPSEPPAPLRTRDLKAWIGEIQPNDGTRAVMERSFDACVDRWIEVRDQTVRPAQAKVDAAPDDAAAIEARQRAISRAFEAMRTSERTMFDAIRAADLNAEQTSKLDRIEQTRARKRASAVVRSVSLNLPRVPGVKELAPEQRAAVEAKVSAWEQSVTPLIDRLAQASVDPKMADQAAALGRKLLASQRGAVREIATVLPAPEAAQFLEAFRRRALSGSGMDGFPSASPMDMRERLDPEKHAEALEQIREWEQARTELDEARMDAMLAEPPSPEALQELASRAVKLNAESAAAIAEAAGMPDLAMPTMRLEIGGDGSDMDLEDLALGGGGMMVFSSGGDGGDPGMGGNAMVIMQSSDTMPAEGSTITMQSSTIIVGASADSGIPDSKVDGNDPAIAAAMAAGAAMGRAMTEGMHVTASDVQTAQDTERSVGFGPMGGPRPMSRQEIERLRVQLGVPDVQRAIWDTLAEDLLKASGDWMKAAPAPNGMFGASTPAPGQSPDAFTQAQAARRAELARIEDGWFANVKSGVSGIDAATLETERSRRALARAQGALRGGGFMMSTLLTSRQLRLDLDQAAADLSPAGRARCAAALQAWRTQLIAELATAQSQMDDALKVQMAFMQSTVQQDDAGNMDASVNFTIDEKQAEQIERARKPLEETIARIDASQRAAVDAVATTLSAADAPTLRRAARRQTHPEAYRSQEKVDAAVARVLALPDLSTARSPPRCLPQMHRRSDARRGDRRTPRRTARRRRSTPRWRACLRCLICPPRAWKRSRSSRTSTARARTRCRSSRSNEPTSPTRRCPACCRAARARIHSRCGGRCRCCNAPTGVAATPPMTARN